LRAPSTWHVGSVVTCRHGRPRRIANFYPIRRDCRLAQGAFNCFDQLLRRKRLAQISNTARFQCFPACQLVIMAGHVNYRKPGTRNIKSVSQFNPRHATELDVQKKTINLACNPAPNKFFCRQKTFGCKSLSIEQILSGPEHVCIVIDNSYDSLSHRHQHLVGRLDALAWLVPLPHRALCQKQRSRRHAHWGRGQLRFLPHFVISVMIIHRNWEGGVGSCSFYFRLLSYASYRVRLFDPD
jgi:hypothetical protein